MKYLINLILKMRILKSISVALIAAMILASCGTTKTTTTNATNVITIITATDSIVAKKGEMSKADVNAWPHTDVFIDSVPGMSLAKAYDFEKTNKEKL